MITTFYVLLRRANDTEKNDSIDITEVSSLIAYTKQISRIAM